MLFILVILTVLLWQRFDGEVKQYSELQKTLMQQQAIQSARSIENEVNHIRHQMAAISLDDLWLSDLAQFQNLITIQETLGDRLKLYFPKMHAYLIASDKGEHIGGDTEFFVGMICQTDIEHLATMFKPDVPYFEYEPYIHAKEDAYHFDVMMPVFTRGKELIFFMSFDAKLLSRIVKSHVISEHITYLVRKDIPDLIEVSAEHARDKLKRSFKLSETEMSQIVATEFVEDTRWKVIVVENPKVIQAFKDKQILDTTMLYLVLLAFWGTVFWLGLHHEKRRVHLVSKLSHLSMHDALTGLANRRKVVHSVTTSIERATEARGFSALLYMDLDGFKSINDNYGHEAGDFVLVEFAKRLKLVSRHEDVVARIGGDEFVVLLNNLGGEGYLAETALADTLKRFNTELNKPYSFDKKSLYCMPSTGVMMIDGEEKDASVLIAQADAKMYESKKRRHASEMDET